jgi:uncharacterized protein (TIGR02246 family)
MKAHRSLWIALLLATAIHLPAVAKTNATVDVARVVNGFTESWNHHDMNALANLYAKDADFVNVIGMWWRGRDEILREHVTLHNGRMKQTTLATETPVIRLLAPNVAVAHAKWELRGDAGAPGWKVGEVRRGILSHVLVKQADGWKIVSTQNTDIVDLPNN